MLAPGEPQLDLHHLCGSALPTAHPVSYQLPAAARVREVTWAESTVCMGGEV